MSTTQSNLFDAVAQVYAQALLDMADEANQTAEVAQELEELGRLLEDQPEVFGLLSNRVVSVQERAKSIESIFQGNVGDLMYRFLQVVNQKSRFEALPSIVRAYDRLLDERNGVIEADAYVAAAMDPDQAQATSDRISQALGRNVVLRQHVDPQLIGGLKIRVGDRPDRWVGRHAAAADAGPARGRRRRISTNPTHRRGTLKR